MLRVSEGHPFSPEGGRGLARMTSRSLFQPWCSVVVKRQIAEKESQGPWPEFLSLINLLLFQASSLCPQINLPWLPAGTEGPIDRILFSRLRVKNRELRLAKALAWAEGS